MVRGCSCCGDCDACTVVCVACVYAGSFHVKSTSGPEVIPSDFDETSSE